jgi:hypothetical protein
MCTPAMQYACTQPRSLPPKPHCTVYKVQLKAASMTIKKEEWVSFRPVEFELFIEILKNIGKYL